MHIAMFDTWIGRNYPMTERLKQTKNSNVMWNCIGAQNTYTASLSNSRSHAFGHREVRMRGWGWLFASIPPHKPNYAIAILKPLNCNHRTPHININFGTVSRETRCVCVCVQGGGGGETVGRGGGGKRECHNHKPQPFPDTKRMRKQTKPNKRKSNKRTKST